MHRCSKKRPKATGLASASVAVIVFLDYSIVPCNSIICAQPECARSRSLWTVKDVSEAAKVTVMFRVESRKLKF